MKRFIVSVLFVAVFFIGLGELADSVRAGLKSDQKALDIIAKARQALGGDAALAEVRSMVIVGRTSTTIKIDGADRTEQGETEIAMQFPDKLMKKIKIGNADGVAAGEKHVIKSHDVIVMRKGEGEAAKLEGKDAEFTTTDGKTFVIKKGSNGEFTTDDGKKVIVRTAPPSGDFVWKGKGDGGENVEKVVVRTGSPAELHGGVRQNELLRMALMLLVKAPDGMDVSYTFDGEGTVDGTSVNIIAASFAGSTYRLHLDKSTNLPVAFGYKGLAMPQIVKFTRDAPNGGEAKEDVVFTKRIDVNAETTDALVKFADFRSTGGVLLPYRWTTTAGGQTTEIFDVTSYEVNPANIADRFSDQKIMIRTSKPAETN